MSELLKSILEITKSLTLTNVLMFGLLILFSFPAYVGYRIVNDEKLMTQITSSFEEMRYGMGDCLVYRAQQRGEMPEYLVRYNMRHDKYGVWYLAVRSQAEPTRADAAKKCEMMAHAVEIARKAIKPNDLFPGEITHDRP